MPTTADYLNQLIDDKADLVTILNAKGVTASDTETFTELVPKVDTIPSGSNIGYTVKFKVEGNDYYEAQCLQGDTIVAPPDPVIPGKTFGGWLLNGSIVSFPFTPSENVELTAYASTYNWLAANNETISIIRGFTFTCNNLTSGDGFANDKDLVASHYGSDGMTAVLLVTKVSRNNAIKRTPVDMYANATNSISFNGETYYYARLAPFAGDESDTSGLNRYRCTNGLSETAAVTELLTAYFNDI